MDAIDAERPDAVMMAGDIFDDKLAPGNTMDLIEGVSAKYPCYYVTGNHEFWTENADGLKGILESYGVKVLEGTSGILEARGEKIRISGIDDPELNVFRKTLSKHQIPPKHPKPRDPENDPAD